MFELYFCLSAWHVAMESRPPLRIDMSGPTPTTYSPRNKPLYETNAPAYSFGRKDPEISNEMLYVIAVKFKKLMNRKFSSERV